MVFADLVPGSAWLLADGSKFVVLLCDESLDVPIIGYVLLHSGVKITSLFRDTRAFIGPWPENKELEITTPGLYKTRCGCLAVVERVWPVAFGQETYPIRGVLRASSGHVIHCYWQRNGNYNVDYKVKSEYDLVEKVE